MSEVEDAYGDGQAGIKTAATLATFDLARHPLNKHNTF